MGYSVLTAGGSPRMSSSIAWRATRRATCSADMGRYGEAWGDMGRYGEIWGGMGRDGERWGEMGRDGEIEGDRASRASTCSEPSRSGSRQPPSACASGRYGEIWGDMGRYREI